MNEQQLLFPDADVDPKAHGKACAEAWMVIRRVLGCYECYSCELTYKSPHFWRWIKVAKAIHAGKINTYWFEIEANKLSKSADKPAAALYAACRRTLKTKKQGDSNANCDP